MRIKNIVFSGFAAAMFASVCGVVDAATLNLASKSYVDEALATKQNALTAGDGIDITDNVVKSTVDTSRFVLKGEIPVLSDFATDDELAAVKKALQEEIAAKQAAGDYATAAELESLSSAVEALQAGGVDKTVLESLKKTVDTINSDYAKKTELTDTEARLQTQIEKIVVPSLEGYAKLTDVPSLDGYAKTSDIETVYATKSELGNYAKVADLQDKADASALEGLVDTQQLTKVQEALQAAIDGKQDTGDYLTAASLSAINQSISELQSGKADKSVLSELQTAVSALGNTYATDAELASAIDGVNALIAAMNVPTKTSELTNDSGFITNSALEGYAKTTDLNNKANSADVYSKGEADSKFLMMQDSNALGANLQWDENGKLNTKGIATADGLQELEDKVADAVTESELTAKGYQTASDVQGAITTATADLATKSELGNYAKVADLQDKADASALEGLVDTQQLTKVQEALQAAIDGKQDTGDYLTAASLSAINQSISELQSGKADKSVLSELQTAVSALGNTYATDAELSSAIDGVNALIAAVNVPTKTSELTNDSGFITNSALEGYAKTSDIPSVAGFVTEEQLNNIQTTLQNAINEKQAKGEYALAADLTKLQEEVENLQATGGSGGGDLSAIEARIKTIEDTYATDADLTQAIDEVKTLIPSMSDFATKDELNAFVQNPAFPEDAEEGDYVLFMSYADGKRTYEWINYDDAWGSDLDIQ